VHDFVGARLLLNFGIGLFTSAEQFRSTPGKYSVGT
jgi:hypothetical protein